MPFSKLLLILHFKLGHFRFLENKYRSLCRNISKNVWVFSIFCFFDWLFHEGQDLNMCFWLSMNWLHSLGWNLTERQISMPLSAGIKTCEPLIQLGHLIYVFGSLQVLYNFSPVYCRSVYFSLHVFNRDFSCNAIFHSQGAVVTELNLVFCFLPKNIWWLYYNVCVME